MKNATLIPDQLKTAAQQDVSGLKDLNNKKGTAAWGGCSTRQIELLVAAGKFPAPIRLGSHPRWRRSDLLNWLEAQSTGGGK